MPSGTAAAGSRHEDCIKSAASRNTARNGNEMEFKEFAYCSDKYQYTMGKSFMECGNAEKPAVFNLFYRKAPENNNWADRKSVV